VLFFLCEQPWFAASDARHALLGPALLLALEGSCSTAPLALGPAAQAAACTSLDADAALYTLSYANMFLAVGKYRLDVSLPSERGAWEREARTCSPRDNAASSLRYASSAMGWA